MAKSTITTSALGLDDATSDGVVMDSEYGVRQPEPKKKRAAVKPKVNKPVASEKLPPNPFVHEILDRVNAQRTLSKRIEVLEEYRNDALTAILIWNFDDSIESVVPEGVVPYEKNSAPLGTDHTTLRREWKNLYNFVKGGNNSLSNIRRETMFIQMLEGLHPDEAEILCLVKDKELTRKYPKINQGIVEQAFPDIKWGDRVAGR
tara:strand:- start:80 stop:691 length:612 start_codon:yes stop_codon:yes gene_type:complete